MVMLFGAQHPNKRRRDRGNVSSTQRFLGLESSRRLLNDTETTNAIAIGTLAIKAKIGELLKAPSPKEAGSRKGNKKGFLPDRNPFNKNTRTSFRKLDKHKPRISEYREKVDSHNAKHPNDVLDITTAGFLSYVGSDGERTIRDWLSRIDKDSKEARNKRIFDLWLACWTAEEIASEVGITKQAVNLICQETASLPKLDKPSKAAADHATDFAVPIYNVWRFKERSDQSSHFGNTEVKVVDNLLYLYTSPFDVVLDPFAGGGSTIDICKKRFRRYFVSDRKPIIEREKEI